MDQRPLALAWVCCSLKGTANYYLNNLDLSWFSRSQSFGQIVPFGCLTLTLEPWLERLVNLVDLTRILYPSMAHLDQ